MKVFQKRLNVLQILLWLWLILFTNNIFAQTYVSAPLTQPNTSGEYYNQSQIVLAPGFSATATNGNFRAYIDKSFSPLSFSGEKNYVSSWRPSTEIKTINDLKNAQSSAGKLNITVKYFDELGRTEQVIEHAYSPGGGDLVQPYLYDEQCRLIKTFLPYTAADGHSGEFRPAAITTDQPAFYNGPGGELVRNVAPFYEVRYESSPLERLSERGKPGVYGQLSGTGPQSGHTLKYEYLANNNISLSNVNDSRLVHNYGVNVNTDGTRSLTYDSDYAADELFVNVVKDENWSVADGRLKTKEVYLNKEGRMILSRTFSKGDAGQIEINSTYYVYDDFDNLCFVLPPASNPDQNTSVAFTPLTSGIIDKYCVKKRYDAKQRLIEEKSPGKGLKYYVYNGLNLVVAVQGATQRAQNEWMVRKYDINGRIIITGVWNNANLAITRANLQLQVDAQAKLWEERMAGATGYTNGAWPQTLDKFYAINYYDDYNIPELPAGFSYQNYVNNSGKKDGLANGNLTVVKTWSLSDQTKVFWKVNYFDYEGRCIQSQKSNQLSGTDLYNNEFDFIGNQIRSEHTQIASGQSVLIATRSVFDNRNREVSAFHKVNNLPEVMTAQFDYNELGQLSDKKLHKRAASRFLQSIDYRYDINGKLTSVNDPSSITNGLLNNDNSATSDEDKFSFSIAYEEAVLPQFNGNIGAIAWKVKGPPGYTFDNTSKYDFRFDGLNRLTEAVSSASGSKDGKFSEFVSYDNSGNVKKIGRWASMTAGRTQIDSLSFTYLDGRLDRVDDNSTSSFGFKESPAGNPVKQSGEMTYNAEGFLAGDKNKGIISIVYNNFDQPSTVTYPLGKSVEYIYDGTGTKLSKIYRTPQFTFTTDYVSGLQYVQGELSFINREDGRVIKATDGSYIYQYDLVDHLGNTHVVIQPNAVDDGTALVMQVNNYYPFGLKYGTDNPNAPTGIISGLQDDYQFGGKEYQDPEEMYDFGARMYDPAIARWNAPDPENQFESESPYAAFANNPVAHIDKDGKFIHIIIGAAIGAVVNVAVHVAQGKTSFRDIAGAAIIGAGAGALGAATGGATLAATGFGAASVGGGLISGFYGAASGSMVQSLGNAIWFGDRINPQDVLNNAVIGGITGGILGGVANKVFKGTGGFWTGVDADMPITQADLNKWVPEDKTPTVTAVVPKSQMVEGFGVPKYYVYKAPDGQEFFVAPHTMKHLEELRKSAMLKGPDYMRLIGKQWQNMINSAIDEISKNGQIQYGLKYFSAGNEIIFSAPRLPGELPAVTHFMKTY